MNTDFIDLGKNNCYNHLIDQNHCITFRLVT